MTFEQLQTAVEALEALSKTGNDFAEVETQARLLLAEESIANEPELHCKILLALSSSLWRYGLSQEALPFAEKALSLAQGNQFKQLEARALNTIGLICNALDDYPRALEDYSRALAIDEELGNKSGVAIVTGNIGLVYSKLGDLPRALEYMSRALAIDEELGNKSGVAIVTGSIGLVYRNLGDLPRALEYMSRALVAHEELGEKSRIANVTGNIGTVYNDLSDYPKALEYYGKALALNEELGVKSGIAGNTFNIGCIYSMLDDYPLALEYMNCALAAFEELGEKSNTARVMGRIGLVHYYLLDYPRALEYYGRALAIHEELGNKRGVATHTYNIGDTYKNLSDYPRALEYMSRALAVDEELGNKSGIALKTGNIGMLYAEEEFEGYNSVQAEEYLLKAIAMCEELGTKWTKYKFHKELSDLYKRQERWKEFATHYEKYHELKDEVQSEEAKKKAEQLDYERKTAEREKQLAVERAEAATVKRILHNTLPPIIADRLINNETFIADSYPNVSVLFMDLVNFTRIAAIIPPRHLIYVLNTIFSNADAVMEKHGLEKIKTIGDAYMAVAGAPVHQDDHAQRAALAALDVMEAMNNLSVTIPEELGETSWTEHVGEIQVRIGLHCGEAIGGVIGDKKFSFDLWGDAVNTAARMESHGEAGKIHCSEEFKNALVETQHAVSLSNNVQFISRGEMEIKGKGIMRTYFLEKCLNHDL